MAELSKYPKHERRFIERFPLAYNEVHGTRISGEPGRPGALEQGWDYRWPDPDRQQVGVEVQHTAAASNADFERVHASRAARINHDIQQHLNTRGNRGHIITIRAADTPRRSADLRKAVDVLCAEIDKAIEHTRVGVTARGSVNWRSATQRSAFDVQVRNLGGDFGSITIMTPTPTAFVENASWRMEQAVRKKSGVIGYAKTDTVLLVDFDLNGFDDEDVEVLVADLRGEVIPFREVWIADLKADTRIQRVWTRDACC